ncbi:DUF2795 domain-containing protein [Vulgatibacter sp.]|uniref:DUF2795 domain-containing protein n=1 Tax=Vulgatibacter sp. TaxID=1971226 RepID=UPI003569837F
MARGVGERLQRSASYILETVEYPATREDLVQAAEDGEAPVDAINFLKSLPDRQYRDPDDVLREFAEAQGGFGLGPSREPNHRGNIGKEMTEPPGADHANHP